VTEEIRSAASQIAGRQQIAGYRVEAEIGRGGMAIVYRARDIKLDRPVALKVLAPQLAEDETFRRRFIHESRAAAAVDHPHIVPVFEAGEAGGVLFIAMRYVSTGDVRTLLQRQGRLPAARAVAIASQAASAIDAAHARGLVHRDIKPANMLLATSADGRTDHVYLSDFGLSKDSLAPTGLTSTGQFMGTLDYVAPEQIEGRPVDGRADQYALACATMEMLTGAPPFKRDQNLALMWAQLSEPPPAVSQRRPELPPAVDQVMSRALAKAPDGRYRTCTEFAVALRVACLARPGPPLTASDPVPTASMAPVRRGSPVLGAPVPGPPPAPSVLGAGLLAAESGRSGPPSSGVRAPSGRSPSAWPQEEQLPAAPEQPWRYPQEQAGRPGPGGPADPVWLARDAGQTVPPGSSRDGQPEDRHSGRTALIVAAVLIAVLLACGVALGIYHRRQLAADQTPPVTTQSQSTAGVVYATPPARIVQEYFRAINLHRYTRAWHLGGKNTGMTYVTFVLGFRQTDHDAVHVLSTSGKIVTARLVATQTNGTVQTYQGTYTISHGAISLFDVRRVS
jgi:serine/threonine protein kinase